MTRLMDLVKVKNKNVLVLEIDETFIIDLASVSQKV